MRITEKSDKNGSFYVSDTGDPESAQIRLSFVEGDMQSWRDFTINELKVLIRMLDETWNELFAENPSIRCSACGYSADDASFYGDHQQCRRFPFFPGERGESHAVNI